MKGIQIADLLGIVTTVMMTDDLKGGVLADLKGGRWAVTRDVVMADLKGEGLVDLSDGC